MTTARQNLHFTDIGLKNTANHCRVLNLVGGTPGHKCKPITSYRAPAPAASQPPLKKAKHFVKVDLTSEPSTSTGRRTSASTFMRSMPSSTITSAQEPSRFNNMSGATSAQPSTCSAIQPPAPGPGIRSIPPSFSSGMRTLAAASTASASAAASTAWASTAPAPTAPAGKLQFLFFLHYITLTLFHVLYLHFYLLFSADRTSQFIRSFEAKGSELVTTLANQFIDCFGKQNQVLVSAFQVQCDTLLQNLPRIIAEEFARVQAQGNASAEQKTE